MEPKGDSAGRKRPYEGSVCLPYSRPHWHLAPVTLFHDEHSGLTITIPFARPHPDAYFDVEYSGGNAPDPSVRWGGYIGGTHPDNSEWTKMILTKEAASGACGFTLTLNIERKPTTDEDDI